MNEAASQPKIIHGSNEIMKAAIFLCSQTASNAEALIVRAKSIPQQKRRWDPVLLVSDRDESRCMELAETYDIEQFIVDCRHKYEETRGKNWRTSGRAELDKRFADYVANQGISVIAFAGWEWWATPALTENFYIVNMHPGDQRHKDENGKPLLRGLHHVPIKKAILACHEYIHSSTFLVNGGEDEGPAFMVSDPLRINMRGYVSATLPRDDEARKRLLDDIAKENQQVLKQCGDVVIFPPTLHEIAQGHFAANPEKTKLWYKGQPYPVPMEFSKFD